MDEKKQEIVNALITALNNDSPDSIEFGSASKGGCVKVYGNFSRPEEFQAKINKAIEMRRYAQGGETQ